MQIEVERWPELRDPVLVVALSGWVDAGLAGAGAAAVLAEQLESARRFGHVDLTDAVDLQQTRPTVKLVDGATREISWPSVDLVAVAPPATSCCAWARSRRCGGASSPSTS